MNKRIMIVEDEPITALALKTNLEAFGYEVVAVESSGRDAIETCLKVKPDLILMDITLSDDIDGISAVNEITRHLDIPYIYLTAHTDEKTINRAKETAPYGYLIKPIELNRLKHTIDFAITRHEMEQRVKESEAMFNYLANAAPVMIWMCDEKGQVTFLNDRYRDYLGLEANDINCNSFIAYVHPEDIDYLNLHMKDAFTDPKESSLHYRIRGKDNNYRYFLDHAIPIYDTKGVFKGYIGSNMDVDEIITLQEKVKKLSFVVEHGPAVVVITDKDGNIEYVNPKFSELTGYSSDEVIGENPRILKSGLTPQKTYEELWKTISSGAVWRGELCNKKKSGELYWELALISPLYDGHGNLTNFI
ncbi:MAG: PAS domain S-box protein, partial [Thermodesulfovibrionales bacterium]|nr:PAS domain S-box protein [Thermodesulfovibrionales bacterium]